MIKFVQLSNLQFKDFELLLGAVFFKSLLLGAVRLILK